MKNAKNAEHLVTVEEMWSALSEKMREFGGDTLEISMYCKSKCERMTVIVEIDQDAEELKNDC